MRIVEFVGFIVALLGLSVWLLGRPHTLESIDRDAAKARTGAAPVDGNDAAHLDGHRDD